MPTSEDQASQASGSNKPKKGSLWQKAVSTYKQARQKVGSIKGAWKHARKPSIIYLAREARGRKHTLEQLAKKHQKWVAGGKGAYKGTPWE
jgi:hypothetical protein